MKTWALPFAAALLVGGILAAQWVLASGVLGEPVGFAYALAWTLPEWLLWAALSPLVFALARRRSLTLHVVAGAALSVAHAVAFALVTWPLPAARIAHMPLERLMGNLVLKKGLTNLLVYAGLVVAARLLARHRERQLHASRLEAELARAHLQALRMQLHPHFLFNALNALSELIHRDPKAADRMVSRLGDMLRATLDGDGADEVTLGRELEWLGRYLDIERVRFQDRLEVDLDVDPACLPAAVPALILQPLVENALRHGVASRPGASRVAIRAARHGDALVVTVTDDGAGLPRDATPGVGLANSRARLARLHGGRARLELKDGAAGGVEASLHLPFRALEDDHGTDPDADRR